jgi:hypothetical protein
MSYYINDTTINEVVRFIDPNEVVGYLENLCRKKFKKSRKEFMFEMESLGHGYDDPQGANFTAMMGEYFEVGALKKDGRMVRTNIHEMSRNLKYRKEMGD